MKPIRMLFLVALLSCAAGTRADGVGQLRAFVDGTRSLKADFSQTVSAKSGRKPQVSSGSFVFSRPGKFRWTYDKPYYQLLVSDGDKLWIHDRDLNQVTEKRVGNALGGSPAALLAGDTAFEKSCVSGNAGSADGLDWVEATPKQADGSFERVRIGFKDNLPRAMELHDSFGQTTQLGFSAIQANPAVDSSLFRFAAPPGADVVTE